MEILTDSRNIRIYSSVEAVTSEKIGELRVSGDSLEKSCCAE